MFLFVLTKDKRTSFRFVTHDGSLEYFIQGLEEPDWELALEVERDLGDELQEDDEVVDCQGAFVLSKGLKEV